MRMLMADALPWRAAMWYAVHPILFFAWHAQPPSSWSECVSVTRRGIAGRCQARPRLRLPAAERTCTAWCL